MLIGGDYSLYDPIVDWINHDWDFAFIKASEGAVPDPRFRAQWTRSKGRIRRGPYHFFRPAVSVQQAVEVMIDTLDIAGDRGELPPVLDLEAGTGIHIPAMAAEWLMRVENIVRRKPILYTSLGFISGTGGLSAYNAIAEAGYPLWLAEYPWDKIQGVWTEDMRDEKIGEVIRSRQYTFRPIGKFGLPDFIQWTAKALPIQVPGYPLGGKKAVDVNFCRLTMEELDRKYRVVFDPTTEEPPMADVITLTADLGEFQPSNLRDAPGLTNTAVRKTMTGPVTIKGIGKKVQKEGYYWIQIVAPHQGWVALTTAYENVRYNELGVEQPPNPTPTERYVVRTILYYNDGSTQSLP